MRKFVFAIALLSAAFSVVILPLYVHADISDYFDTIQKIYIGYYQRPADPEGLIYWAGRLNESGGNLTEIIEAFASSSESHTLYSSTNSSNITNVVDSIYHALFNRHAETDGLNYYVNGFNSGKFTAASIMLNILDGAQNQDLHSISKKLTVANMFTRVIDPDLDGKNLQYHFTGGEDAFRARDFLSVYYYGVTLPTEAEIQALLTVPLTYYTYTFLPPPEGWIFVRATAINNARDVIVSVIGERKQFRSLLYRNGTYALDWHMVSAVDINNIGDIVACSSPYTLPEGFIYSNGIYTILRPDGWTVSQPYGITDGGLVIGTGINESSKEQSFIYNNGVYTILSLDGPAIDMNDKGQVIGNYGIGPGYFTGFLYDKGTYTALLPEGWKSSTASRINANGQVIGNGIDASEQEKAFLYSQGSLTVIFPQGWKASYATGINDKGQIVGYGLNGSYQERAFVYNNGLYTIILPKGCHSSGAMAINNNGLVAGWVLDSSSLVQGFIATPQQTSPLDSLIQEAKDDLAQWLSVAPFLINLIEVEEVTWSDGCLGCYKPGIVCTQAQVDGYRIQLEFAGTTYEYHSNMSNYVTYCENPN